MTGTGTMRVGRVGLSDAYDLPTYFHTHNMDCTCPARSPFKVQTLGPNMYQELQISILGSYEDIVLGRGNLQRRRAVDGGRSSWSTNVGEES